MNMKKIIVFILAIVLLGGAVLFILEFNPPKTNENQSNIEKPKITVFYSPTCSCCREYISYLKTKGFSVEEKQTRDMLSIKEQYNISQEMESCHTSVIRDYFVEGHIPIEAIEKLSADKSEIDGIALPGMPVGSPGMGGFKMGKFKIYGLSKNQASIFNY